MQSYLTIDRGKAETVLFKMGLCLWIYIYISTFYILCILHIEINAHIVH